MRKLQHVLVIPAACVVFSLIVSLAQPIQASTITMQTRFSSAGAQGSASAYKSLIDSLTAVAPTPGYCDVNIATYGFDGNQFDCPGGSTSNVAYHYAVAFGISPGEAGLWSFRFSPDFGNGGALFLDGAAVDYKPYDIFDPSYSIPAQYLFGNNLSLAAGNHLLDVYGLENCCDGPGSGQYLAPGSDTFLPFSTNDSFTPEAETVPEPGTWVLLALGLTGLLIARLRQKVAVPVPVKSRS